MLATMDANIKGAGTDDSKAAGLKQRTKKCWGPDEDGKLKQLVSVHGTSNWSVVAQNLGGRTGKQCRERWHNHLDPEVKKGDWTEAEDILILDMQRKLGNQWAKITKVLPGRTDNAVKNRWHAAMRAQIRQNKLDRGGERDSRLQSCASSDSRSPISVSTKTCMLSYEESSSSDNLSTSGTPAMLDPEQILNLTNCKIKLEPELLTPLDGPSKNGARPVTGPTISATHAKTASTCRSRASSNSAAASASASRVFSLLSIFPSEIQKPVSRTHDSVFVHPNLSIDECVEALDLNGPDDLDFTCLSPMYSSRPCATEQLFPNNFTDDLLCQALESFREVNSPSENWSNFENSKLSTEPRSDSPMAYTSSDSGCTTPDRFLRLTKSVELKPIKIEFNSSPLGACRSQKRDSDFDDDSDDKAIKRTRQDETLDPFGEKESGLLQFDDLDVLDELIDDKTFATVDNFCPWTLYSSFDSSEQPTTTMFMPSTSIFANGVGNM